MSENNMDGAVAAAISGHVGWTYQRTFLSVAGEIEKGISEDGATSSTWVKGMLVVDEDGEDLGDVYSDDAVAYCVSAYLEGSHLGYPPEMLLSAAFMARTIPEGARGIAPMVFSGKEFLTETFPELRDLLDFANAMVDDPVRFDAVENEDWYSDSYALGGDGHRAYALLRFIEGMNDDGDMTAAMMCDWLRAAAADAAAMDAIWASRRAETDAGA